MRTRREPESESEALELTDEDLLHLACKDSPLFLGIWRLLDVDL